MIKSYATKAAYTAATHSTIESEVSLIETTREIIVDGINVVTTEPVIGDAMFLDEGNNIVFLKGGDWLSKPIVPNAWTFVGVVGYRAGRQIKVLEKSVRDAKYADVVQFKVTVPSDSGNVALGAQFVTAGTTTTITVAYDSTQPLATTANTYEENETTFCGKINTALAALEGITGTWWAYQNADGDVILQRDTWTDYRQYTCSGALTHITWGDMPASSALMRETGRSTYYAPLSVTKCVSYYSTNGSTPTSDWPVNAEGFVNKTSFENSEYCATLRATYATYNDYIAGAMARTRMKYGVFGMMDGATISANYATLTAPTKDGSTKYKFPVLAAIANISYNNSALAAGSFHLMDVHEAYEMLVDDVRPTISATMTKMGATSVTTGSYRWFAQRYSVYCAWFFYASYGALNNGYVNYAYRAQGVLLLSI